MLNYRMKIIDIIKEEVENWFPSRPTISMVYEDDYKGEHSAPTTEDTPMYKADEVFGEEIYTQKAFDHFGRYSPYAKKSILIIQNVRNKPNAPVKIYRAVPENVMSINNGDWVTINKDYAEHHGKTHLKNEYKILTKTTTAKNLFTDGNDVSEWGYVETSFE